jgi:hypothetical protein
MIKRIYMLLIVTAMLMGIAKFAHANPINYALTGSATQRSTYKYDNPVASRAIDGNTNGNFFAHSVPQPLII